MPSEQFNLRVIDQAYGPNSDLYVDVLRVSYLASEEEIQTAFFDRRSEIFTILSKLKSDDDSYDDTANDEIALSQRRFAERRMDAVVMAFRILKRPESRKAYEKERERRIASRSAPNSSSIAGSQSPEVEDSSPTSVTLFDELIRPVPFDETVPQLTRSAVRDAKSSFDVYANDPRKTRDREAPRVSSRSREVPHRIDDNGGRDPSICTGSLDDSGGDSREERSDRETSSHHGDEVQVRRRRTRNEGVVEKISETSLARTIADEVRGVYLDTITAFDQVFNAFTLQEQDIQAVCGRIEVAKKQLSSH